MKIRPATVLILAALFLFSALAESSASTVVNPFQSGGSAFNIGRAGTGVSAATDELSDINPASMALLERSGISLNYGSLNQNFTYPYMMLAIPTSYGVTGLSFGYFTPDSTPEQKGYVFSFFLSKELTQKFLFGIALEGAYTDYGKKDYYAGIKPGFIYKFDGMSSRTGFGFFDPSFGMTLSAGYGTDKNSDMNSVTAGYSFSFYRDSILGLGFYNDYSSFERYGEYAVKFGIESVIYDSLFLKCGAIVPDSYEYMTYTAGAGYRLSGSTLSASVNYALAYSRENGVNHFAGISLQYGSIDREPPLISINPDYTYISPNYDGVQDYLVFDINVRDRSRISGWKLQISDSSDTVVKEFKMSDREIEQNLTFTAFFKRLFSTRESMTVPEKILWDGSDNAGNKLADGKYRYHFYAWDSKDNIAPVKSGVLAIDSTSPAVEVTTGSIIFSPNGDRNKDTLIIKQKITSSSEDIWRAEIRNSSGAVVASYEWNGTSVPEKFIWDGKDSSGTLLPDGLYFYSIASTDRAGNRAAADIKEIILTTKMETADIRLESGRFSYSQPEKKSLRLFPDLSSVKGIERWEVTITESDDKSVRGTVSGAGTIPAFIDWECLDSKGKKFDDGEYNIRLSAWYSSGNNPVSFPKKIVFDSTPPKIEVSHDPSLFSPDNDGENDYLTINIRAEDNTGFGNWDISIYNESGILFKKFSGNGAIPKQLKWDGTGDNGETVESASDYDVQFNAVDMAGNRAETATDRIAVDILVIVTERGLKMRISNIEFDFGSAVLHKRGTKILDRVTQILNRYGRYNIVVEGHTDDKGDDDFNLKLSEKRALTVKNYLVSNGISETRLKYIGMGESLPFYPNTSDENRRRNRRVEFLLLRDKEQK